jgi:hypothetical protein
MLSDLKGISKYWSFTIIGVGIHRVIGVIEEVKRN